MLATGPRSTQHLGPARSQLRQSGDPRRDEFGPGRQLACRRAARLPPPVGCACPRPRRAMVVPIIGRDNAAVVGGRLVATGAASVIGTLIVPRSVANWLTRWVDLIVNGAFRLATAMSPTTSGATGCSPRRQATILIAQLPPGRGGHLDGCRAQCTGCTLARSAGRALPEGDRRARGWRRRRRRRADQSPAAAGPGHCLHLVRFDLGAEAASLLASWLVIPPHRPGARPPRPPRGPASPPVPQRPDVRVTAARAVAHAVPAVPAPGSPSGYQYRARHPAADTGPVGFPGLGHAGTRPLGQLAGR